jgi:hypothetical protein
MLAVTNTLVSSGSVGVTVVDLAAKENLALLRLTDQYRSHVSNSSGSLSSGHDVSGRWRSCELVCLSQPYHHQLIIDADKSHGVLDSK